MDIEQRESALAVGEKIHIVERRQFDSDLRRHFIGEVEYCSDHHLKIKGKLFVYNATSKVFERIEPSRFRIYANDNNIGITILPQDFDLPTAVYKRIPYKLLFCDANGFEMELGDIGTHG
jgi:hypothetical protein